MQSIVAKVLKLIGAKDSDGTEILRGSSISMLMKFVGLFVGQAFAFVAAHFLGAEAWGAFSLGLGVLTIAAIISTLGLDIGLLRLIAEAAGKNEDHTIREVYKKAAIIAVPASILVAAIIWLNVDFLATNLFKKPELKNVFILAAISVIPATIININSQSIRGFKLVPQFVFLNFVGRFLFALAFLPLAIMLFRNSGLELTISYLMGLGVLMILSYYWVIKRVNKVEGKQATNNYTYKSMLAFSLPLMMASSLMFIKGWVDTFMLGIFMETSDVGVYNVALKLATVISIPLTAVNIIAAPKFAEEYGRRDFDKLGKIALQSSRMIFMMSFPVLIIYLIIPSWLLGLFGSEFEIGSTTFILLAIGYFVNAISGSVGYFLQMTGSQVAFQNISLISVLLGIGLNFFLIPQLGMEGAGLSTLIGMSFWNLSCVAYIKYKYGILMLYIPFITKNG